MNLKAIQIKLNPNTIKFQFTKADGGKLTFAEFIQFLKTKDQNFLNAFNEALEQAGSQLSAYFWECIPVSQTTKGKNFEFVVVKSEALDKIKQDYSSFQEYFDKSQDNNHVVSFPSLSGDTLVVPMPNENKNYKNLKEFINHASSEQKNNFWQKVGEEMEEKLLNANGNPRWLSTSGLGVSYLHVRIDRKPKYYSFDEYKKFEEDNDESNNQNDKNNKSPTNDDQPTSVTNQSDDNPNQPNSPNEKNPSSSNNNSDSQPPKTDESAKLDKKPSDENKSTAQQDQTPDKFSDNSQSTKSDKKPTNYLPWIAGGAALLIILVIFLLSKKKKNSFENWN